VPIEGVLLTDAEVDHSLGIVLLREAAYLPVYATAVIQAVLDVDSRFLAVARAFADMPVTELPPRRANRAALSRRHAERPAGRSVHRSGRSAAFRARRGRGTHGGAASP